MQPRRVRVSDASGTALHGDRCNQLFLSLFDLLLVPFSSILLISLINSSTAIMIVQTGVATLANTVSVSHQTAQVSDPRDHGSSQALSKRVLLHSLHCHQTLSICGLVRELELSCRF